MRLVTLLLLGTISTPLLGAPPCERALDDPRLVAADLTDGRWYAGVVITGAMHQVSANGPATVRRLRSAPGTTVETGDVLLELSSDRLEAALAASRSSTREQEARVRESSATVRHIRSRLQRRTENPNLFPAEETEALRHEGDAATAALDAARSALERHQTRQAQLESQRAALTVRSSQDGVVAAVFVSEGEQVPDGAPLLRLVSEQAPLVRFLLDSRSAATVALGSRLAACDPESGANIEVEIHSIGDGIDPVLGGRIAEATPLGDAIELAGLAERPVLLLPIENQD